MRDGTRIVLVEESEPDAAMVWRALRVAGIGRRVLRVTTDEDLRRELMRGSDIVLTELSLARLDAARVLDLVGYLAPDVPVIVVTATMSAENALECHGRGATDYVLKHRLAALGPAVRSALDDRRRRQGRGRADTPLVSARDVLPL